MNHLDQVPLFDNGVKIQLLHDEVGAHIKVIVQKFLNTLPDRLQNFTHALNTNDLSTLQTEAHKLKGAAATLGAEQMVLLCQQLEQATKANHPPSPDLILALTNNATLINQAMSQAIQHI